MIGTGIWVAASPSRTSLLFAAIALILVGCFTLLGSILTIVISITLIAYGVSLIHRYRIYGPSMDERPDESMLSEAKALLDRLQQAIREDSTDTLRFSCNAENFVRRLWVGLLQDDMVVLIGYERRFLFHEIADVCFLSPAELSIDMTSREVIGRRLKGTLTVQEYTFKGIISPECYARYEAWIKGYLATTLTK